MARIFVLFAKSSYLCSVKKKRLHVKNLYIMKRVVIISIDVYTSQLVGNYGGLLSLVSKTTVSELHQYVRFYFDRDDDFSVFSAGLYQLGILHRCVIL